MIAVFDQHYWDRIDGLLVLVLMSIKDAALSGSKSPPPRLRNVSERWGRTARDLGPNIFTFSRKDI
jgi:hypothetical protein